MSKVVEKKIDLSENSISSNGGESSEQLLDTSLVQMKQEQHSAMFGSSQNVIQNKENGSDNNTGLPDSLKAGVEALSGQSMDDVKVHRNSSEPAKVGAHAFAQGSDIHLGSGQEQHLAHEAWHVVQQKQGRVQATTSANGTAINDDASLEKEADVMGAKAVQAKAKNSNSLEQSSISTKSTQLAKDDEVVDITEYQNDVYAQLGTVKLDAIEGYEKKKELLEKTAADKMKALGAGDRVSEVLALPLIDHRISILSRGSKAQKLAEGLEVQDFRANKYNEFLNKIGKKIDGEVHAAPLKNFARMKTKEDEKYGGDIDKIKDVIRASFIFDNVEQIENAQKLIPTMNTHKVLEIKNRFDVKKAELEKNLNYRDVIFIVENTDILGKPVKIELQLHLRSLHDAKTKKKASFPNSAHHAHVMKIAPKLGLDKSKIGKNQYTGHDFYKVIRELDGKTQLPIEIEIVAAAKEQSKKIYGGAWTDYKTEEKNKA